MKFLTIIAIFSVVVTLGNSAPTFLQWFGFDIDQATTELPDGDNSSPTDIPYDTTQTSIEVSTEGQQNTETPGTESTTHEFGSGDGDALTTTQLPLPDSGDSDNDNKEIGAPQANNEAQKGEQDDNVNIENPDKQNKEDDKDNSLEIQDPWKEFEEQLNEEWGQDDINEDDSKEGDDDDKQNYKKKGDEDDNAREAIKQYIRENIETVCSYDECNDQCQVRHNGGYCKYESECICF